MLCLKVEEVEEIFLVRSNRTDSGPHDCDCNGGENKVLELDWSLAKSLVYLGRKTIAIRIR